MGISFSDQETEIILNVIASNLTAGEQAKFETIKMLAKMLTERNPGNSMGPNESNI